jgi:Staphylococcal nuclease homologue
MVAHSRWRTAAKSVSQASKYRRFRSRRRKARLPAASLRETRSPLCYRAPKSRSNKPMRKRPTATIRIIAYAFAKRDGADHSVQADLVAAGHARVAARVGNRACAMELLRRETLARKAKLGLWGSSYYDLLNADNPTDVLAEQGRFALVEGRVLSVRGSGATIYVNFGRRWTEDFTVTILKRNERNFTAAGLEPKKLAGRQIRVRGWIEERGGPWIEATRAEQIEFADRE